MPKQTFLKLKEEKKTLITNAFLTEFSLKTFDEASISTVVKQLGIAKGSVYQYFDNKMDLYLYLIECCQEKKMQYITPIQRQSYPDFWSYFISLYEHGFHFDEKHPLESSFLHKLASNHSSPSMKDIYKDLLQQSITGFEKLVQHEIDLKLFRNDVSAEIMGFQLYKFGVGVQEYFEQKSLVNPIQSIEKGESIFKERIPILMEIVKEMIQCIRPAFDKK